MEREIETIREMPHWSYTAFQTYLTCPMRYYFRYIEHAEPERTSVSLPFGRAFHAVLSLRAEKGSDYSAEDAKEDFAVYFRGETEVSENLTYKADEDYWYWQQRGCDMLDVALAEWSDDYTVKSIAEAFSVDLPGLNQPLIGEFDLVVTDGGDEAVVDWKTSTSETCKQLPSALRSSNSTEKSRSFASTYSRKPKRPSGISSTPCGHRTSLTGSSISPTASKRR